MSVVPDSQLRLMRSRQLLKQAVQLGQWDKAIAMESELFSEMDNAMDDPQRSSKALLKEMSRLIVVYRDLSVACAIYAERAIEHKH